MLIQTSFGNPNLGHLGRLGQLGDAAEDAQTNNILSISQQETQLRITFAKLLPDLVTLQVAGKDVPPALLDLMRRHNAAQASFMEAAGPWLQARAQTAAGDLPDPGAQAIAVPTFELPAVSGLGRFGFGAVPAATIRIKHGIVGKEISTGLGGFAASGFNGHEGLGAGLSPLGIAIVILLGLAIVGATVAIVAFSLRQTDTIAANQAITEQAAARVREVIEDRDLFVSTRDTCIGNSKDQTVRLTCIKAAGDVLKAAKEGRPVTIAPVSPVTIGVLSVLGVLAVAGTAGYIVYRVRRSRGHVPRMTYTPRRADNDDDMED